MPAEAQRRAGAQRAAKPRCMAAGVPTAQRPRAGAAPLGFIGRRGADVGFEGTIYAAADPGRIFLHGNTRLNKVFVSRRDVLTCLVGRQQPMAGWEVHRLWWTARWWHRRGGFVGGKVAFRLGCRRGSLGRRGNIIRCPAPGRGRNRQHKPH